MKPISQNLTRNLLFAGLAASLAAGTIANVPIDAAGHGATNEPCCGDSSEHELAGETEAGGDQSALGVNFASVSIDTVHKVQSGDNNRCFQLSDGWDKCYVIPGKFVGPKKTCTIPNFPNPNKKHSLIRISTCNESNLFWGNTLETGILIQRDTAPNIKQCRTNALACTGNTGLTTNRHVMQSYCYRALVYYKSASLPLGQTNIHVEWKYE